MIALQTAILAYALNSLWQVPLVALAASVAARLGGRSSAQPAQTRHHIWVAALLLEVFLPACSSRPAALLTGLVALFHPGHASSQPASIHVAISSASLLATRLPPSAYTAITVAYLASVAYFLLRLCHGLYKTQDIVRTAHDLPLTTTQAESWKQAVGKHIRVASSHHLPGPVTLGLTQPVLLLPADLLDTLAEEDLAALFAHEAAHILRSDFVLNLLYTCLALPIAYHPALWFTRARLAETREMICDALAAGCVAGSESYTRSLLRLAEILTLRPPASTLHAIGFLDAHTFERRLMNLTSKPFSPSPVRRVLSASACALLAFATCTSALALRITPPAPSGQQHVDGAEMASRSVSKVAPVYPAEAKANHDTVDGPVVLHVVIARDGTVQSISVLHSLRPDYDSSALEAVRQWRWEPFTVDGTPVEVDTSVTVNYNTDHSQDKAGK